MVTKTRRQHVDCVAVSCQLVSLAWPVFHTGLKQLNSRHQHLNIIHRGWNTGKAQQEPLIDLASCWLFWYWRDSADADNVRKVQAGLVVWQLSPHYSFDLLLLSNYVPLFPLTSLTVTLTKQVYSWQVEICLYNSVSLFGSWAELYRRVTC